MQEFNYHSHTYRCGHADLDLTDEEYVEAYIKMGFKRMAFTDHCPEKNKIDKREDGNYAIYTKTGLRKKKQLRSPEERKKLQI